MAAAVSSGVPMRAERDFRQPFFAPLGRGVRHHVRLDAARRDAVDADMLRGQLARKRIGKRKERALRRAVDGTAGGAGERCLGREENDGASAARAQQRYGRLRGKKRARKVYGNLARKVRLRDGLKGRFG